MSEHIIKIESAEVQINLSHGHETVSAKGVAFDSNAAIVAEETTQFSGFCDSEIITSMVNSLVFTRRFNGVFIDMPQIMTALKDAQIGDCTCED